MLLNIEIEGKGDNIHTGQVLNINTAGGCDLTVGTPQ
jgi:hypothetical protein